MAVTIPPSGQKISESVDFLITDWVLTAGVYVLDINHNLDNEKINVALWENGNTEVEVDRKLIINQNTVRLFISYDPDCRFSGTAVVFKTQE